MTKTELKNIVLEVVKEYRTKGAVGKKTSGGSSMVPSDAKVEKAVRTFLSTRKDHAPHIDQLQDIAHMLGLNSIKNDIDNLFDAISDKLDTDKSGFEKIYSYLSDKKLVKEVVKSKQPVNESLKITKSELKSIINEVVNESKYDAESLGISYANKFFVSKSPEDLDVDDIIKAYIDGFTDCEKKCKPALEEELQGHKQTIDFVNDMEKIVNDSPELKKYSHIKEPLLKAIEELKSGSSLRGKAKMLEDLSKELVELIKSPLFKSKPTDYNKNIAIFSDKVKKIAHS